ncbi:hypothetical protein BH10CYA1_BH10CYA1_64820 [soil metagenome]
MVRCPLNKNETFESEQEQAASIDLGERYTVLSKLGEGANVIAYKIFDQDLRKNFVIKVLRPELSDDAMARKRFDMEADASASLTHANIVSVYGRGVTPSQTPYLLMDYVDGRTLEALLQKGEALNTQKALSIFTQIAEGLVHMHMKGIVHRDLKPSNILIVPRQNGLDEVKIFDFGIAKNEYVTDTTRFTQVGDIIGSPPYMSPEQCQGGTVDGRSDIYSFGCVMFEALAGRPPFTNDTPIKIVLDHVHTQPPVLTKFAQAKDVPLELEQIISLCLSKNPLARYQTPEHLFNDLRQLRDGGALALMPSKVLASTWKRFAAGIIDGVILGSSVLALLTPLCMFLHVSLTFPITSTFETMMLLLGTLLGSSLLGPAMSVALVIIVMATKSNILASLVGIIAVWICSLFYFSAFESSRWQGTPGKLLLGLAVVDRNGEKVLFGRATMRWFSRSIFSSLLMSQAMMLGVTLRARSKSGFKKSYFRELARQLSLAPADTWSRAFVVERKALNNPYVPSLSQYFAEEPMSLRALHAEVLAHKMFFIMLLIALVPTLICSWSITGSILQIVLMSICLGWQLFVFYLSYRFFSNSMNCQISARKAGQPVLTKVETTVY